MTPIHSIGPKPSPLGAVHLPELRTTDTTRIAQPTSVVLNSPGSPGLNGIGAIPNLWSRTLHQRAEMMTCETVGGPIDLSVQYHAAGAALGIPDPVAAAIKQIGPATVQVRAYAAGNKQWLGSGVMVEPSAIDPDLAATLPPHSYLILTNHHVANTAQTLTVVLADGTEVFAHPLRSRANDALVQDEIADTAVLLVNVGRPLATARLATAEQLAELRQGDTVITAGYPVGLPELTVTKGVISQPGQQTGFTPFRTIQVDAPINGGNSGGPLVWVPNAELGRNDALVIGLNTFTLTGREGMSFAMPVTEQVKVLRNMYRKGAHARGDLGITWEPFPLVDRTKNEFPGTHGAKIGAVDQWFLRRIFMAPAGFSPKAGDIVTEMTPDNGPPFALQMHSPYQATHINAWIQALQPGTRVTMKIHRQIEHEGKRVWREFTVGITVRGLGEKLEEDRVAVAAARTGFVRSARTYLRDVA